MPLRDIAQFIAIVLLVVDLVLPYLLLETVWSAIHSIQAGAIVLNPASTLRPL